MYLWSVYSHLVTPLLPESVIIISLPRRAVYYSPLRLWSDTVFRRTSGDYYSTIVFRVVR